MQSSRFRSIQNYPQDQSRNRLSVMLYVLSINNYDNCLYFMVVHFSSIGLSLVLQWYWCAGGRQWPNLQLNYYINFQMIEESHEEAIRILRLGEFEIFFVLNIFDDFWSVSRSGFKLTTLPLWRVALPISLSLHLNILKCYLRLNAEHQTVHGRAPIKFYRR